MNSNKITSSVADISQRKAALVAGFGLLVMTIAAIFANFAAIQNLLVPGNATETVANIMANEMIFRTGIISFLIVFICDILVAWALYVFLKPVNKSLSLLTAWFRLVYTCIAIICLFYLVAVLRLINPADFLNVFERDQLNAQILQSINSFNDGWAIGFVIFGLHLGLLGYLVFKSGYVHKILGILIMIAGLGYFIDSTGKFLITDYNLGLATFTFIGELILMFWLLFKGGKSTSKLSENE